MALELLPKELMGMPASDIPLIESTKFPRIIHQSWKSTILPPLFEEMSQTWRQQYSGFIWVLWTDEDNLQLVKERAPEHLELYQAFPREIYRVDFARNLYMREFGGIYVDLDYDSYKCMEDYLKEQAGPASVAFLGRSPQWAAHTGKSTLLFHSLPNSFMASTPGHAFWDAVMARTHHIWYNSTEKHWNGRRIQTHIETVTGPINQYHAYVKYAAGSQAARDMIIVIPAELVNPCAWYITEGEDVSHRLPVMVQAGQGFDIAESRNRFNNGVAYACTYHACSWGSDYLEVQEGETVTQFRIGDSFQE